MTLINLFKEKQRDLKIFLISIGWPHYNDQELYHRKARGLTLQGFRSGLFGPAEAFSYWINKRKDKKIAKAILQRMEKR